MTAGSPDDLQLKPPSLRPEIPLTGMTVGITGAAGFVGRHLARVCRLRGAEVRGLDIVPLDSALTWQKALVGDVHDEAIVREFCESSDVVFHTAAIVKEGGHPQLFRRVNVDGVKAVASAAAAAGVRRLIQISSIMVYGFHANGLLDECSRISGDGNPYCETKIEGERVALRFHSLQGLEVAVARCGDIYGPGSVPWTIRPMNLLKAGALLLPNRGRGMLSPIYIGDLVEGLLLLLSPGASGEVFNLAGSSPVTCQEFFLWYTRMLGTGVPRTMPASVLRVLIWGLSSGRRLCGLAPRLHPDLVDYLNRRCTYSSEKARNVLGFRTRYSLAEGMQLTEEWLRQSSLLPKSGHQ